jgi:acetyl-CoA acetyltransferase
MSNVYVLGVGMTPFTKPGNPEIPDYHIMAANAVKDALKDAGIDYKDVEQAHTGYVYGESCCGMRALYEVGQTGIPIFNYNSNCSTGSSALFGARQAVESGMVDCALVLGFEKMEKGALGAKYMDREFPTMLHMGAIGQYMQANKDLPQGGGAAPAAMMFGTAGYEYQQKHGIGNETFAKIQVKARKHAEHNQRALFTAPLTVEEILESPLQIGPLTRLQCCPPTCGAAAAIIVSDAFLKKSGMKADVKIVGQAMETDSPDSFDGSMMSCVGYGMAERAAKSVYEQAGIGAEDVNVVELHDCFTANELITYESLGLTPEGTAEKFIADGDNTYGGKIVTNPSGGLLSKGHPLGATGLAQCFELVNQLRGNVDKRQVEGAKIGLQHNVGIGGACVVTMYQAV